MYSHFSAIVVLTAFLIPVFATHNGQRNELAISDAENVIAIYTEDHGWASTGKKELVLAIWPNGDCIFSADSIAGGEPFRRTRVSKETIEQLFAQIQETGFLESANLNVPRVPPDSKFSTILIRIDGQQLKMQSTHEIASRRSLKLADKEDVDAPAFPVNPVPAAAVRQQQEIQANEDKAPNRIAPPLIRTRLEQISSLTKDDLIHRVVWSELRMKMECIHPSPSKVTGGELRQENGRLSWQPTK